MEYKPEYSITKYNCEHFANACVLGLDFSEHHEMKNKTGKTIGDIRSIYNDLTIENAVSHHPGNRISEIEGYRNNAPSNYGGIKLEDRIKVVPKYWYRLRN